MKFNLSRIKYSHSDKQRKIKIPIRFTPDLAEEIGIHIGDGNLSMIKDKKYPKSFHFRYRISGDLSNELNYHKKHIFSLLYRLYNCPKIFCINKKKNSIQTVINSKAIFQFKTKIITFSPGSKEDISIPEEILKNEFLVKRCIAGIIDTDFTLDPCLNIQGSLTSLKVINQIHHIFNKLGIEHSLNVKNKVGYIRIHKHSSVDIIKNWKLYNHKHLSKYFLHLKYGESPTFTTTNERLSALQGVKNFQYLKRISKQRRKEKKAPRTRQSTIKHKVELFSNW